MRIYLSFGLDISGLPAEQIQLYKKIVVFLENRGHEVVNIELITDALRATPLFSKEYVFENSLHHLKDSDLFIGEISHSSFASGFELSLVILLYDKKQEQNVSTFARGCTLAHCYIKSYTDFTHLTKHLSLFMI